MEEIKSPVKRKCSDAVGELCHDFTNKVVAMADEYGKDRNKHMKDVLLTLLSVNLKVDFSKWQIGGDK